MPIQSSGRSSLNISLVYDAVMKARFSKPVCSISCLDQEYPVISG